MSKEYFDKEIFKKLTFRDKIKCDVWNLGIILYKLIFGKYIFDPSDYKNKNEYELALK